VRNLPHAESAHNAPHSFFSSCNKRIQSRPSIPGTVLIPAVAYGYRLPELEALSFRRQNADRITAIP
jgi:hypothetical protein